jgi:phage nucleotide-binding protein
MNKVRQRVEGKMKKASELPHNQNILIYGEPGSGKTRVAASAPKPLIIDINDQGQDSVRRDYDPMYYPVERWSEINDVYWYLQEGEHDFLSVAIDHVTNLQNLALAFVIGDEAARDASKDPDMPSRQAWGKANQLMKTQIINFRNLPLNTIFLAHVRANEVEGEDDEVMVKLTAEVSPGTQKVLTGAVGTIGYLTKREVFIRNKRTKQKRREIRRRLYFGDSERYVSKDRNFVFGEFIDAPDLTTMLNKIYEGGE